MTDGTPPVMNVPQETGFDEVGRFLRSRDFAPLPRDAAKEVLGNALVSLHGAEHRARRAAENPLFRGESLARYEVDVLRPSIGEAFAELTPGPDGRAFVDVPPFVTELILNISLVLIGIDRRERADRHTIFGLIDPLIAAHEVEWTTGDPAPAVERAMAANHTFWAEYVEPAYRRRQAAIHGGGWTEAPDLLSVLAAHDETIDDKTVGQEAALYLIASVLTTSNTITNTIELLLGWLEDHPEDRARILDPADDFLLRSIEETLRLRPPIKPLLLRVASGETPVCGHAVAAGEVVGANIPAAHHDPEVYPDRPDEFDPLREPAVEVRRTHYSFGDGPHLCIGRPLVIGDQSAGTVGDAVMIARAFFERDVRRDETREPRLASSTRRRYVEFWMSVRLDGAPS